MWEYRSWGPGNPVWEDLEDDDFYLPNGANYDDDLYKMAKCSEPHEDGSPCIPEFDGFVYICVYRLVA